MLNFLFTNLLDHKTVSFDKRQLLLSWADQQSMPITSVRRSWPMQILKGSYMWWKNYWKWPMCHKNNWHTLDQLDSEKWNKYLYAPGMQFGSILLMTLWPWSWPECLKYPIYTLLPLGDMCFLYTSCLYCWRHLFALCVSCLDHDEKKENWNIHGKRVYISSTCLMWFFKEEKIRSHKTGGRRI